MFPFHIDLLERTVNQLKRASNYSNLKNYLDLEVVLNMSDKNIDWSKCNIPKQYFIDRFYHIEKYCDFLNSVNFEIDNNLLSSGEQHRRTHDNNNGEYNIIALDPDIYFPPQIFQVLEGAVEAVKNATPTYMISFQIPKWWDSSWDIISHPDYINTDLKVEDIDVFELESKLDLDNLNIFKNYNHKFAGGWFTFYSSELSKLSKLPQNVGAFYHQDFFLQEKFKILNTKGYDIPQYIIQNCLVAEDRKYYHQYEYLHKNYLPYQKNRPHMKTSEQVFKDVINELNKIKNG